MKIIEIVSKQQITEKTKQNVIRKSEFIDYVQFFDDGTPMFSWIDISLTELCNRVCSFCPRADGNFYPNQNLHMELALLKKIKDELTVLKYKGGVVFSGYGEPLLHPRIVDIIKIFGSEIRTEIVSNGDKLTSDTIAELYSAGLSFLCVSLYDSPDQIDYFDKMFYDAGISKDKFILRDRWHTEADSFGLKLTNRGGVMDFGPSIGSETERPCYYLTYSMAIDWNGDALLCVQDWQKKVKFGNVNAQSLEFIWRSNRFEGTRSRLTRGQRHMSPCRECNTDGTFHGFNHVNAWHLMNS